MKNSVKLGFFLWIGWGLLMLSPFVLYALSPDDLSWSPSGSLFANDEIPRVRVLGILGTIFVGLNGLAIIVGYWMKNAWTAIVIVLVQWILIYQFCGIWLLKWQNRKKLFPVCLSVYFLATGLYPSFLFFCLTYVKIPGPEEIHYHRYFYECRNQDPPRQLVGGGNYTPLADTGEDIWIRYECEKSALQERCDPKQKEIMRNWFLQYGLAASTYKSGELEKDREVLKDYDNLACLGANGFDDQGRPTSPCSDSWHLYHQVTHFNYYRFYCGYL